MSLDECKEGYWLMNSCLALGEVGDIYMDVRVCVDSCIEVGLFVGIWNIVKPCWVKEELSQMISKLVFRWDIHLFFSYN